ncbi:MAG TPA: hypothetical protein VK658_22290, partial [Chryseolinea sp.]|nr:hypothetical protein [Chryseolinea sp.]
TPRMMDFKNFQVSTPLPTPALPSTHARSPDASRRSTPAAPQCSYGSAFNHPTKRNTFIATFKAHHLKINVRPVPQTLHTIPHFT